MTVGLWGLWAEPLYRKLHVVPVNDLWEHDTKGLCWCAPEISLDNPDMFIHRSADGREDTYDAGKLQ